MQKSSLRDKSGLQRGKHHHLGKKVWEVETESQEKNQETAASWKAVRESPKAGRDSRQCVPLVGRAGQRSADFIASQGKSSERVRRSGKVKWKERERGEKSE